MQKAHDAVKAANIRSVKSAAIVAILDQWDDATNPMGKYTDSGTSTDKTAQSWTVTATITEATGAISLTKIVPGGSVTTAPATDSYSKDASTGVINIVTTIVSSEIKSVPNKT